MTTNIAPAAEATELREAMMALARQLRRHRPDHGLPLSQLEVLSDVSRAGVTTPAEIAARLQVRAQSLTDSVNELESRGVTVNYAIHPVAGRMPGHMNVLLAEADVPYEQLREMEDINTELPRTDVAVVIGANDVTNPAAKDDPSSPIAGMPIIEVNEAHEVIVIKRSLSPGFAGIDNDLFYEENTSMLFADAKQAAADIAGEIGDL